MTTPSAETTNASLTRDVLHAARYYVGSRRGILIVATVAIVAGIAFNWNWLVATGVAPILLTALPCAVMCGLGLCMNRLFGSSCESRSSQSQSSAETIGNSSAQANVAATSNGSPVSLATCCQDQALESGPADLNKPQALNERRSPNA